MVVLSKFSWGSISTTCSLHQYFRPLQMIWYPRDTLSVYFGNYVCTAPMKQYSQYNTVSQVVSESLIWNQLYMSFSERCFLNNHISLNSSSIYCFVLRLELDWKTITLEISVVWQLWLKFGMIIVLRGFTYVFFTWWDMPNNLRNVVNWNVNDWIRVFGAEILPRINLILNLTLHRQQYQFSSDNTLISNPKLSLQ